ncbi:MAG: addiction module protein [Bacteroidia bacterium]|nr:addiction module protein [Bacteroidia bacterium]
MKDEILKYILTLELYDKQLAVDALWEKIAEENAAQKSDAGNSGNVKEPDEKYENKNNSLESWREFAQMLVSANKKIFSELMKLSVDEKISLVQDIWDGISNEVDDLPPNEEELAFIKERYESYKKNPENVVSWEEVKRRFLER